MGAGADNSFSGVIERIIYFNEENHYCIGEFRKEKSSETVTITGKLPGIQCGETLSVSGEWVNHAQHGRQFAVKSFTAKLPSSVYGIRKYLGSGLVPGIGKTYANKIVDFFGEDTLNTISEESARLREVPGIGKQRAKSIKKAWDDQAALRDIMMFLQTYGVTTSQCLRLVKKYGNEAKQILKNEPYRVAKEIEYIGFKTADKIALNLGFANDSPPRLDAGILYAMGEIESDGHTSCEYNALQIHATELLQAHSENIGDRLDSLIKDGYLIHHPGKNSLQLPASDHAETVIANNLSGIGKSESALPSIKVDKAVEWVQARAGFEFADAQVSAISAALRNKLTIITGSPGTGKTTILRAIVEILKAKKVKIVLAAPTGRAAQRMTDATSEQALTIHRLLKYDPLENCFTMDEENPLKADYVIIDEASMLDNRLSASLIRAINYTSHLLLVGDINQLPSVGSGNILHDLISSNIFHVISLDKIFRQKGSSNIITTAHEILRGNKALPPQLKDIHNIDPSTDLHFIKADSPEACIDTILELCTQLRPLQDIQVLAPMHRGVAGINNLNETLQKVLNPYGQEMIVGQCKYMVNDKVIQTKNNYDKNIFNGDIGTISSINRDSGNITVEFDIGPVELERLDISNLRLAYSISIHKSQGSEFPIVIIPILKQHYLMLQRNLIYTAITRGKKRVFLVGDPMAYAIAVNNKTSNDRQTDLQRKIAVNEL